MALTTGKVVPVTTAVNGTASIEVRLYGVVVGIGIRLGTLSTPDIAITDGLTGAAVYSAAGVATDKRIQPRVLVQDAAGVDIPDTYDRPVITGMLEIAIVGGGNAKTGEIVIIYE